jgi:hypothetical protein
VADVKGVSKVRGVKSVTHLASPPAHRIGGLSGSLEEFAVVAGK